MPSALKRACPGPGCASLVQGSQRRCPTCETRHERQRLEHRKERHGTCDYNSPRWRQLRQRFRVLLLRAGIAPVCGARLPGAPVTEDSTCQRDGVFLGDDAHKQMTGHRLNADHIVPHDGDEALFLDVLNLQLLCDPDHAVKTQREGEHLRVSGAAR